MYQKNKKMFFLLSFFGFGTFFCEDNDVSKEKEIKKEESVQYSDDSDEDNKSTLSAALESELEDLGEESEGNYSDSDSDSEEDEDDDLE